MHGNRQRCQRHSLVLPRWDNGNGEERERTHRRTARAKGQRVACWGVSKFLWPSVGKGKTKSGTDSTADIQGVHRLCACRCILCDPGSTLRRAFHPVLHQRVAADWPPVRPALVGRLPLLDGPFPPAAAAEKRGSSTTCAGSQPARWRSAEAQLLNCQRPASPRRKEFQYCQAMKQCGCFSTRPVHDCASIENSSLTHPQA